MKLLAVILLALVAVQAAPRPGTVMSFDDVDGDIQASYQKTDSEGKSILQQFKDKQASGVKNDISSRISQVEKDSAGPVESAKSEPAQNEAEVAPPAPSPEEAPKTTPPPEKVTDAEINQTEPTPPSIDDGGVVRTFSSSKVTKCSSSSSSYTDENGNTRTSGSSNDYSSKAVSHGLSKDGKTISSDSTKQIDAKSTDSEGYNGVEKVRSAEMSELDKDSDVNGKKNHESHYTMSTSD